MVKSPTFYEPELHSGLEVLGPEESSHCIRVLRRKAGDRIRVIDGMGTEGEYEILEPDPRKCRVKAIEVLSHANISPRIHIAIAPTKQIERMEWFVEKSTEIGIGVITLIKSSNSERRKLNMERLIKKSITALKQSGQVFLPVINPLTSFSELINQNRLEQRFIAYVGNEPSPHLFELARKNISTLILIGPEGDFSTEEIFQAELKGFQPVSLGKSTLRTETAGIAACHILNLVNII